MPLTIQTTTQDKWKAYDKWIELDADQAAYTASSPENALVLLGPARRIDVGGDFTKLKPIGLLQNFTIGQSINWQAQQMIGSGRTFFLAGKAPGNGSISRLFTSASTLLGAIYQIVVEKVGTDITKLESPAYDKNSKIMFSLDTELLKIPIGMVCVFRNTVKEFIGGFYVECMVIPNINMGFAVGQPAIFETVNVMFDRVLPFDSLGELVENNIKTSFDKAVTGR